MIENVCRGAVILAGGYYIAVVVSWLAEVLYLGIRAKHLGAGWKSKFVDARKDSK